MCYDQNLLIKTYFRLYDKPTFDFTINVLRSKLTYKTYFIVDFTINVLRLYDFTLYTIYYFMANVHWDLP